MITLESKFSSMNTKRMNKIRRLAQQFRAKRQQSLGLLAGKWCAGQLQQQNDEGKQQLGQKSKYGLPSIDYTSESSSDEADVSNSSGVHTGMKEKQDNFVNSNSSLSVGNTSPRANENSTTQTLSNGHAVQLGSKGLMYTDKQANAMAGADKVKERMQPVR